MVELRQRAPESLAEWKDWLPSGGCCYETDLENWLDKQLHEARGCLLPRGISQDQLGGGFAMV